MIRLTTYYRVSTRKQGESGLGLEGQKAAVETYAHANGAEITKSFTEVESGTRSDRPQLAAALAHCRRSGSKLVVAKMDRLSRNVAFLAALMESGVDFIACDNPHANRLTVHILAAVAEEEARAISARTKAALAAAKARGTLLGAARPECRNLSQQAATEGRKVSALVRSKAAAAAYADLYPLLREKRAAGLSIREIAAHLNSEGYTTSRGKAWTAGQVFVALRRARAA